MKTPQGSSFSTPHEFFEWTDLLLHIDISNEDLGKRRVDGKDEALRNRLRKYIFRRKVIPSIEADNAELTDSPSKSQLKKEKDNRDLATAFRILAATRSPDKEGDNFGAAAVRDDASVSALSAARAIELRVVELLNNIGLVVVNGEQNQVNSSRSLPHLRSDPVFEYFCEKSILTLLVDIAKEVRYNSTKRSISSSYFHGVVWSPLVKAQIMRTVSLLISDVRSNPVLYYLLSQNNVNDLINCMLPLQQWTDPALEKMMPAYVDLLRNVAAQLASDPHLFPFLTTEDLESGKIHFPLFSAALDTAISSYAHSDSFVYGTCIGVVINIMQIPYLPIRSWVGDATADQRRLSEHLCQRLLERYFRIANLATGPVVDAIRCDAIAGQLACLEDQLLMINEVFWRGIRGLNVRLCEMLLRRVVSALLKNLLHEENRRFLTVGVEDIDVIPEKESLAQVSVIFLSQLISTLAYGPLQRMLAVAIFHPMSTPAWSEFDAPIDATASLDMYTLMPALNDIALGKNLEDKFPNPFRAEIIKGLGGGYGDWRTVAFAALLESTLKAEALDCMTLTLLQIIPSFEGDLYNETPVEKALAAFLERCHVHPSGVTARAFECIGLVSLQMIYHAAMSATENWKKCDNFHKHVLHSPVWKGLNLARQSFSLNALKYKKVTGVAALFLDLVEAAISTRYTVHFNPDGTATFSCNLLRYSCTEFGTTSQVLVRKFRGVSCNDVEEARFNINMALHFRSLCKVVRRLANAIKRDESQFLSPNKTPSKIALDFVEKADEISRTIGGMKNTPAIGTDLDLSGRMTFRFVSALKSDENPSMVEAREVGGGLRGLSKDLGVFRASSHLILVLDPTDMFVVKPAMAQIENRGTIVTSISLRCVIAAAADGDWLHVAVRHEDVGCLIKNGMISALVLKTNGSTPSSRAFRRSFSISFRLRYNRKYGFAIRESGDVADR